MRSIVWCALSGVFLANMFMITTAIGGIISYVTPLVILPLVALLAARLFKPTPLQLSTYYFFERGEGFIGWVFVIGFTLVVVEAILNYNITRPTEAVNHLWLVAPIAHCTWFGVSAWVCHHLLWKRPAIAG